MRLHHTPSCLVSSQNLASHSSLGLTCTLDQHVIAQMLWFQQTLGQSETIPAYSEEVRPLLLDAFNKKNIPSLSLSVSVSHTHTTSHPSSSALHFPELGQSQELLLGLTSVQGPKYLSCFLLLFPGHLQGAALGIEPLELDPDFMSNAGIPGGSLTHFTTTAAPTIWSVKTFQ